MPEIDVGLIYDLRNEIRGLKQEQEYLKGALESEQEARKEVQKELYKLRDEYRTAIARYGGMFAALIALGGLAGWAISQWNEYMGRK